MNNEKKLSALEELFELDAGELKEDMVLSENDWYDSMAKLSIMAYIQDEYNLKLTSDQIKALRTVGDIIAYMQ